jgi:hypothetical protein
MKACHFTCCACPIAPRYRRAVRTASTRTRALVQVVTGATFDTVSDADKNTITQTVTAWAFSPSALCLRAPAFIQNKVAQLFAHLSARLYPAGAWPTCFQDMHAALAQHAQHTPMFLRVLLALDQDIISLEIPRNDAESRRSMALKDALRERDIGNITQACLHILQQQQGVNEELAGMCLTAVQRYADWVDIQLIASPTWVEKLLGLLQGGLF